MKQWQITMELERLVNNGRLPRAFECKIWGDKMSVYVVTTVAIQGFISGALVITREDMQIDICTYDGMSPHLRRMNYKDRHNAYVEWLSIHLADLSVSPSDESSIDFSNGVNSTPSYRTSYEPRRAQREKRDW